MNFLSFVVFLVVVVVVVVVLGSYGEVGISDNFISLHWLAWLPFACRSAAVLEVHSFRCAQNNSPGPAEHNGDGAGRSRRRRRGRLP